MENSGREGLLAGCSVSKRHSCAILIPGRDFAALLLSAVSFCILFAPGVHAVPVSDCQDLSSAGVYTLTADVVNNGTCFTVSAGNVILDCGGHVINYSVLGAVNTFGIYSTQLNTTIMNCNVLDGNRTSGITSRYGILFQGAENGTIYNTTVNASNSYAIRFFGADYSVINGSTAVSSAVSIYMYASMNNTVYNTTGTSTGGYGIYLLESHNNTISFTTGTSSASYGIDLSGAYYNTFINASASSSANVGFHVEDGYSKLYNCTGTSTGTSAGSHGMRIVGNGNVISYSTGTAVFGAGIYLNLMSNSSISHCTGISNTSRGILLDAATDNVITDSTGISNTSRGISLNVNSNNNTLARNTGSSNTSAGIFIYSSSGNTLSSNIATSVSNEGISLYVATNTTITGQVALTTGGGPARYAVLIRSSNGTVMRDCANVSGGTLDVYVYDEGFSTNNTFINCSYNMSKELVSGSNSQLTRAWYFDANVTNTTGSPISGASLTAYNYSSAAVYSGTTDSGGDIARTQFIDYVNTGGTRSYNTPHTVNVARAGYHANSTSYNVTSLLNVFATITLDENELSLTECDTLSALGAYVLLNDVSSAGTCFNVTSDDVTLDCNGYWINYSTSSLGYAVYSSGYNNVTVKNCGMVHTAGRDGADGIQLINSNESSAINNTITIDAPSGDQGIYAYGTWNLLMENNTITAGGGYSGSLNDGHGIYVVQGGNATIRNNTITNTVDIGGHGIALEWTRNCTLRSNTMQNADSFSLFVEGYSPSYAVHDIDMSNTADGKAVYYNQSLSDTVILIDQDVSGEIGQIVCFGCTNVTYHNVTMSGDGILLSYTNNSIINASRIVTSLGPAAYVRMGQNDTISSTYMSKSATGMPTVYLDYTYGFTLRDSAVYDTAPSESVTILDSNDNRFINNTVMSTSGDVAGITLSSGNTFTGGYLYGSQWLIGVSTSTVNMTDLTINTSGTYMSIYGSSGRLNLFNVTIANPNKAMVGDASSEAYAYEYVDVNVTNSTGSMISGATIRAYDSGDTLRTSNTSSSTGLARLTVLTSFYNNTYNTSYNNYTINASLVGYFSDSVQVNVTSSSAYTAGNHMVLFLVKTSDLFYLYESTTENDETWGIAAADLDNDGDIDYIAGNYGIPNRIYKNDGTAHFTLFESSAESDNTQSVAAADLDNDGDLDYIAGNYQQPNRIYLNDGTGHFIFLENSSSSGNTYSVAIADIDSDGDMDYVAAKTTSASALEIFKNNGTGHFTSFQNISAQNYHAAVFSDIDNDGDQDIIAGGYPSQATTIYKNNGTGYFTSFQVTSSNSLYISDVSAADIDTDGDIDIIQSPDRNFQGIETLKNNGTGFFTVNQTFATTNQTYVFAVGDVDNDGDIDGIAGNYEQNGYVFFNNGTGGFSASQALTGTDRTVSSALADLDNDGDLDYIAGNANAPNRIFLNGKDDSNYVEITFRCQIPGSTRDCSGAKVNATQSGVMRVYYEVTASDKTRKSPSRIHFGLAEGTSSTISALLPSGNVLTCTVQPPMIFIAYDNGSATNGASCTITGSAPVVTLLSPPDMSVRRTTFVNFSCLATDDTGLANVTLYVLYDNETTLNETTLQASGFSSLKYAALTLATGNVYYWGCMACDASSLCSYGAQNYTVAITSSSTLNLKLFLNGTSATVYVPGSGRHNASIVEESESSPPHFYVASYDGNGFSSLVFSGYSPMFIAAGNGTGSHYVQLEQQLAGSRTFLAFSRGGWEVVEARMTSIEAGEFMQAIVPSFSYGLGKKNELGLALSYTGIDIQGDLLLGQGTHTLTIENNGTAGGKPSVYIGVR